MFIQNLCRLQLEICFFMKMKLKAGAPFALVKTEITPNNLAK